MKQRNMRNTLLSWVLVMAIVLCTAASFLPMQANAASSGEIKKQLEQLKQDKEAIAQQIEKLKTYKQRLISDAVTGKIDVRERLG